MKFFILENTTSLSRPESFIIKQRWVNTRSLAQETAEANHLRSTLANCSIRILSKLSERTMIPPAYHPNRNQQGQWVSLTHRKDTIHTASIQRRNKTMRDRQRKLKTNINKQRRGINSGWFSVRAKAIVYSQRQHFTSSLHRVKKCQGVNNACNASCTFCGFKQENPSD